MQPRLRALPCSKVRVLALPLGEWTSVLIMCTQFVFLGVGYINLLELAFKRG